MVMDLKQKCTEDNMEEVKDIKTKHKDLIRIRSIIQLGHKTIDSVMRICKEEGIVKSRDKVEWLLGNGQVIEVGIDGNERRELVLKIDKLSVHSSLGIEKLGGIQSLMNSYTGKLTLDVLLTLVCKFYQEDKIEVLGRRRFDDLVKCRHAFCFIAYRDIPKIAYKAIGEFLGGRDHSTVIHSIKAVNDWSHTDKNYRAEFKRLEKFIKAKI
jgi:hypothetical protein